MTVYTIKQYNFSKKLPYIYDEDLEVYINKVFHELKLHYK